jgi:sigma-B regulation protein RsbQ
MSVQTRNNVHVSGNGKLTMLFAHGFGCDQNMWRLLAPAFAAR